MERIASFCVDHTRLDRGMYLSRQDGDVLTWDIRMKKPNHGDYLSTGAAHTLEHLFATYARAGRPERENPAPKGSRPVAPSTPADAAPRGRTARADPAKTLPALQG